MPKEKYRVAIGGFFHESNTFNPIITGPEDFIVFREEEIYKNRNAYLLAKGIIEYFETLSDYVMIPLVFAKAVPNGEISKEFYLKIKNDFFAVLDRSEKPDIFVLALHGSMRIENIGSAESDLLSEIGVRYPDIPVFCGLDMHATITESMLKYSMGMVGFKTAPHIDAFETGWKAAEMADSYLKNHQPVTMGYSRIESLIAGEKSETDCEPMKSLIQELTKMEKDPEVYSASYLLGFPWADTLENGVTCLVCTMDNQRKADEMANFLAQKFLEVKSHFAFSSPAYTPEKTVELAIEDTVKPVFISDSGDNPTAGSTGDNTAFISLLNRKSLSDLNHKEILIAGIFDPVAVKICLENIGQSIELSVGGQFDTLFCKPVLLKGVPVKVVQHFGLFNATLILFKTEQFELILTSKHIGFTNAEMFKALDIDFLNKDIIIVKLGYLTEDFREISAKSYLALSQGCTDEVLSRLAYQKKYDLI